MNPLPDSHRTTVAAVATPPGMGAVSSIRISGADAIRIADLATDGRVSSQGPRMRTPLPGAGRLR